MPKVKTNWIERYNNIFGEKHYQICEGKKCQCHKENLEFISEEIKQAYVQGYKRGISDKDDDIF